VFGSCPRQTVRARGARVGVGGEAGISVEIAVGSGREEKKPQAEKINNATRLRMRGFLIFTNLLMNRLNLHGWTIIPHY